MKLGNVLVALLFTFICLSSGLSGDLQAAPAAVKIGKIDMDPVAVRMGIPLPRGSFLSSCGNCRVDARGELTCECRCGTISCVKQVKSLGMMENVAQAEVARTYRTTRLTNWRKCKNGVMNTDGHLMCGGTFMQSCGLCSMSIERGDERLCCNNCKLAPRDSKVVLLPGDRRDTKPTSCYVGSTHWKFCYEGLSNCDGNLVCGACPSTANLSKDVKVGSLEIKPAARSLGTPRGSFLQSCGNCIVDDKGTLKRECKCGSPLCERLSKGKYRTTDLAGWNKCKNGIMNADGNLMCTGSFTQSCGSCVMYEDYNGRLCCKDCRDKKGKTKPTSCYVGSTHWKFCYEGLSNCDGKLACGACR